MYAQKCVFGSLHRVYENAITQLILHKDMPWRCFGNDNKFVQGKIYAFIFG
ncbi:hypothetical protein LguiB_016769 [Lonicera macranthoides]